MNKLHLFMFITVCLLFTACFCKAVEPNPNSSWPWEILVKEKQCGIYEPKSMVIKSQKEFDALWAESQKGIDFGPTKPKVDFAKKWVIASFLGMVKTGGHSPEVESIKSGPAKTLITIVHKRPRGDCFTAQVIEFPYLMLAVDHFVPEKAEFKVMTQDTPCE